MAYHLEIFGLTLDALGVTLEANGLHYCSPWVHIEVILVPLGSMLGSCGCQNLPKRHFIAQGLYQHPALKLA